MIIELFRKLNGTRLTDYAKTEEHLTKLRSYFNEINAVEKIVTPKAFIYTIFQSLDVNFNTPQIATSNKEISEDIDYFVRSLVSEAQSILSKNNITTSTMNLANCTKSSRKKTNESKKICKFCKKPGHLLNECYKKKGIPTRYKARLVARGFEQLQEVNYLENFAPVSEKSTIHVFLTMAAHKKHSVYHLDIKSAFLNGVLEEEVFILPPAPFKKQGKA